MSSRGRPFRQVTANHNSNIHREADITEVKNGDVVRIHYTAKLTDGTAVESSQGREPLEFQVGAGQIIPGLDREISGMAIGEMNTVAIPADADGDGVAETRAVFLEGLNLALYEYDNNWVGYALVGRSETCSRMLGLDAPIMAPSPERACYHPDSCTVCRKDLSAQCEQIYTIGREYPSSGEKSAEKVSWKQSSPATPASA